MNRISVNQWLSEHGIVLERAFVPALKDYARDYKKRPDSAWLGYMPF